MVDFWKANKFSQFLKHKKINIYCITNCGNTKNWIAIPQIKSDVLEVLLKKYWKLKIEVFKENV
jgi:hypothetical protein